jgi:hypothetical protein
LLVGSGVQHEHRTDDLGRGLRIAEEYVMKPSLFPSC